MVVTPCHGRLHGGGVVRLLPVGVHGDHGGDALGHGLGLEDDDLLVLHQAHALLGCHDDVLVVGQDKDDLRRGLADPLENVLRWRGSWSDRR